MNIKHLGTLAGLTFAVFEGYDKDQSKAARQVLKDAGFSAFRTPGAQDYTWVAQDNEASATAIVAANALLKAANRKAGAAKAAATKAAAPKASKKNAAQVSGLDTFLASLSDTQKAAFQAVLGK